MIPHMGAANSNPGGQIGYFQHGILGTGTSTRHCLPPGGEEKK